MEASGACEGEFDEVRLHPEAEARLAAARAANRPPVWALPIQDARAALIADTRTDEPIEVDRVQDMNVAGPAGAIAVRVYSPGGDAKPQPAVLYLHGGCWVLGNLDTHDADCRSLARTAGCVVVAVDYRLAPEHRFPAALEDAAAVLSWMIAEADELGIDPRRVAVCGVSAGGNLAAALTLWERDHGRTSICAQVLVYPITDCDLSRESYQRFGEGYLLTTATMRWSWDLYAPDDREHHLASPLRATDHAGLPSAFVLVAECDPLRDEGREYARTLERSGVEVTFVETRGQVHAFFSSPGRSESADSAHEQVSAWLRSQW